MDFYYLGDPDTIFDWAAMRDEIRKRVDLAPVRSLAITYGLSSTVGYRDDGYVEVLDVFIEMLDDPVRMRFDLAYAICSSFWDHYEIWHYENVQPEDPGHVGDMLDDFHGKILKWVLEGLSACSDIPEVMDNAYFLVSRIGNHDTFLGEEAIPLMEASAGKEISTNTSEGGRKLIEYLDNFFKEMKDKNKTDEDFESHGGVHEEPE